MHPEDTSAVVQRHLDQRPTMVGDASTRIRPIALGFQEMACNTIAGS
jgi:hypothetical protein